MKAIMHRRYGSPGFLRLEDVPEPEVGEDQVLVRVRAASVNAGDWRRVTGKPLLARTSEGLRRPKMPALGGDAAGVVERVGAKVTHVRPGDEVFGVRLGTFAELVAGKNFIAKPRNLTFEEAAALPVAGITALQGLRDKGGLEAGQRALVVGAGGGVGHLAVQIAKALGARVTAVTSTGNLEMVRGLGADQVIDYERENFTRLPDRYDVVLDVSGTESIGAMQRVLSPEGKLVIVGAIGHGLIAPVDRLAGAMVRARLGNRRVVTFIAKVELDDIAFLKELAEAGKIRPVIDRTYPLSETPAALAYAMTQRTRGKVVITVSAALGSSPAPRALGRT